MSISQGDTEATFSLQPSGLLLLVLSLLAPSCTDDEPGIRVSLEPTASDLADSRRPDDRLRVGIGCMLSASSTVENYSRLVDYLGSQIGEQAVLVQRSEYSEMNKLIERGEVDCALVCTGAFLSGRKSFGMEALVVPEFRGEPSYHALILVREDSAYRTFADLRGCRFAMVDPLSQTGRAYACWRALELGHTPDEFFRTLYTYGHDKSIRAVRRGIVDAASVDELVYLHMQADDPKSVAGIRILERSEAFGAPPIVVPPALKEADRERLREVLLAMDQTEEGKRILTELGVDRFIQMPAGLYDSAERLQATVRSAAGSTSDR